MKTKNKLILSLLAVIIALSLYLFLTAKKVSFENHNNNQSAMAQMLEENYREQLPQIMEKYWEMGEKMIFSQPEIETIKNELMLISVPEEHRDMHMNLFVGINEIEKSLAEGSADKAEAGADLIANELSTNPWIKK